MKEFYRPSINDFAPLVKKFGIGDDAFLSIYIINRLNNDWGNIVGDGFANYTKPIHYKDKTLMILIAHETYRMELNFHKSILLKNIEKQLSGKYIERFSFKQGEIKRKRTQKLKPQASLEGKEELVKIISKEDDQLAKEKLFELIQIMK